LKKIVTIEEFKAILPSICDRATAVNSQAWTKENPLSGHCAVVALVAQNLFGGEILRSSLENTEFAAMGSHYFNIFPGGIMIDFTAPQFGSRYPLLPPPEKRTREYLLSNMETKLRYKLIVWRLVRLLSDNNPLLHDPIYQNCFSSALDSPCQKMKFGCVITHNNYIEYVGCNETIKPLAPLCEGRCIRLDIPSRSEPMIGACGHAEELAIWSVIHKGIPITECNLYVAGLYSNCLPWFKSETEHTCLRCAVQQYHAKLKMIYVPVNNRWEGLTPEQALVTARDYAMRQRRG
jgi:deoxycytidylate deaminase